MKHTIWIIAVLFTLSACSKEEQPEAVAEEAATVEAPAADTAAQEAADTRHHPAGG